jgi:hypothetical protein
MATPTIAKYAEIYLAGWDLTTALQKVDPSTEFGSIDTTCFGPTTDETSIPDDIRKGGIKLDGFFVETPVTFPLDTTLRGLAGTTAAGIYYPAGSTAGYPGVLWQAETLAYSVKHDVGDAVRLALETTANAGQRTGDSLHALAARTHPYSGSNYDPGAAGELTAGEWAAAIEATNVTSNLTVLIETSADGSTGWVTLCTFTTITSAAGRGSEYKRGTGAIHRYRRIRTVGGAGTITVAL